VSADADDARQHNESNDDEDRNDFLHCKPQTVSGQLIAAINILSPVSIKSEVITELKDARFSRHFTPH